MRNAVLATILQCWQTKSVIKDDAEGMETGEKYLRGEDTKKGGAALSR